MQNAGQWRAAAMARAFPLAWPASATPSGGFPYTSLCQHASPYKCLPNLFNRQLDYNQISCIEDGAFRALRDLEVL